jgi:hypothetical protein
MWPISFTFSESAGTMPFSGTMKKGGEQSGSVVAGDCESAGVPG